jgi:hypothetical protein
MLFNQEFLLRSITDMTQEEMEEQCRIVSECPEISEEEEIAMLAMAKENINGGLL